MSNRSSILNILTMHRSQQLAEDIQADLGKQANLRAEKRANMILDVCQEIRDLSTQDEYEVWFEAAPDRGFFDAACDKLLSIKLAPEYTPSDEELNQRVYKDRSVPGHACPHCGYTLTVNEKRDRTEGRALIARRLVCPGFFSRGCDYKEPWTSEIMRLLIAEAAKRESAEIDF